ncbi:hypothetical protein FHS21_000082 [Phyllobacterium trifolii]|jgi:hypothetical protein|uniref:Uncharacterized protein n=1 Tax=Phyllobacterium trifolii TaxID=300193 RepID=A0A839U6E6_9HYPH|nr:hypothetical protein [Phyllobacterium trifolii]MBB3143699.1 hypothetical protein [Phyllobacterium trifolii]
MDRTRNLIDTLKVASPILGLTVGHLVGPAIATTKGGVAIIALLLMLAMTPFLYQVVMARNAFANLVFMATCFVMFPIVALIYYLLGWH